MTEITVRDELRDIYKELAVSKLAISLLVRALNKDNPELFISLINLIDREENWAKAPSNEDEKASLDEIKTMLRSVYGITSASK